MSGIVAIGHARAADVVTFAGDIVNVICQCAGIGAIVDHPITRPIAGDIKSNDIDIVGACGPGNRAAGRFDLCCPAGIRYKADACIGGSAGLDRDWLGVDAWQDMHDAARLRHLCGFLNRGKGATLRPIIGVAARWRDVIGRFCRCGGQIELGIGLSRRCRGGWCSRRDGRRIRGHGKSDGRRIRGHGKSDGRRIRGCGKSDGRCIRNTWLWCN
jgi:hypothetical protein